MANANCLYSLDAYDRFNRFFDLSMDESINGQNNTLEQDSSEEAKKTYLRKDRAWMSMLALRESARF
jgi:hypothetical protein